MRFDKDYEAEMVWKKITRFADLKGYSPPAIDYGAIARQQEQERQRQQAIADEKYRVQGVSDYIDYMYDNPERVTHQAATGRYFQATSPGSVPTDALSNYKSDKSITADTIKANPKKYFTQRTSEATLQPGKIRFGRMPDTAATEGLLGSGEREKKTLLGA